MAVAVAVIWTLLVGLILAEDPTCGHCRCRMLRHEPLTTAALPAAVLIVNCSDDAYFPGRLRVPKLAADDAGLPVWAEFRRNRYTYVGDDFRLDGAVRVSLADNEIANVSAKAFSRLPGLRYLSLAGNQLDAFDDMVFRGLTHLEELDLSHNFFTQFPEDAMQGLTSLQTLNLAFNNLQSVGPKAFQGFGNLRTLDLSFNAISEVSPMAFLPLPLLEHLFLADNAIEHVGAELFAGTKLLMTLDLSRNAIATLEPASLKGHALLKKLLIAGNGLTSQIELPGSLTHLDLSDNPVERVQDMWWPLENLEVLLVANMSVDSLDRAFNFKHLQVLNISGNALDEFEVESLPELHVLDASRNNLTSVPAGVTAARMPSLQELFLDGNPVRELVFPGATVGPLENLRVLSLSDDPQLRSVGAVPPLVDAAPRLTTLRLSRNPLLSSVQEGALAGLPLTQLDLSKNALTSLPENLVPWSQLDSVDLQHNPWDCECSFQWLLDVVVSKLYASRQDLLFELRCASPAALRERRMVHFYNWTQKAFCMQFEQLRMNPLDPAGGVETAAVGSSTTAIIIVLSLLAALVVMIAVGVLLQRRITSRRRLRNRRL